jgi:hypothetical protein
MTKSFKNYLMGLSDSRLRSLVLEADSFCDTGTTEEDSDLRFLAQEFYGGVLPHQFLALTHDVFRFVAVLYYGEKP